MKIFGIDPGTRQLGYGCIEVREGRTLLLESGCLRANPRLSLWVRLGTIGAKLEQVLAAASPDIVVVEKAFYGRNVAALIAMGEGRGMALYCAARVGADVFEYAPTEVKKAVTGRGSARKEQVAAMVRSILAPARIEGGLDASDAVAVALCHAQRRVVMAVAGLSPHPLSKVGARGRMRRGRGR